MTSTKYSKLMEDTKDLIKDLKKRGINFIHAYDFAKVFRKNSIDFCLCDGAIASDIAVFNKEQYKLIKKVIKDIKKIYRVETSIVYGKRIYKYHSGQVIFIYDNNMSYYNEGDKARIGNEIDLGELRYLSTWQEDFKNLLVKLYENHIDRRMYILKDVFSIIDKYRKKYFLQNIYVYIHCALINEQEYFYCIIDKRDIVYKGSRKKKPYTIWEGIDLITNEFVLFSYDVWSPYKHDILLIYKGKSKPNFDRKTIRSMLRDAIYERRYYDKYAVYITTRDDEEELGVFYK